MPGCQRLPIRTAQRMGARTEVGLPVKAPEPSPASAKGRGYAFPRCGTLIRAMTALPPQAHVRQAKLTA